MNAAKQIDRLFYILGSPLSFLRLLHATASNRINLLTRSWGPRNVTCNLCGWQGRHFDYFLERHFVVKNSQCPGCGSQTRNRELVESIDNELDLDGKSVLDIAPAPRYREWFESRGAIYISVDLGERQAMARMDATRMAFGNRAFDLVICSHVLEHIPAYRPALDEIKRVLNETGKAIIDVPFSNMERSIKLDKPDHQGHWHEFGMDVVGIIEDAGFSVEIKLYSPAQDEQDPDNRFFMVRKK